MGTDFWNLTSVHSSEGVPSFVDSTGMLDNAKYLSSLGFTRVMLQRGEEYLFIQRILYTI